MVEEKDDILGYQQLLEKDLGSAGVISDYCQCQNLRERYGRIASSKEFKKKVWDYSCFQYASSFDPIDVVLQPSSLAQKIIGARNLRRTF